MASWSLHHYARIVAVATFGLIVAGGLVTSQQAGMTVPDWPLSFGRVMPPMPGGVVYEHTHRMIASTVGLLTIVLAVWVWRRERRRWVKALAASALAAVVSQGLLGGLTVLLRLPAAVSIAHACLAQLFFSSTVVLAQVTSRGWLEPPRVVQDAGRPSLRTLAAIVPPAVLAQLALGAAARHKLWGVLPHVVGALLVGTLVFLLSLAVLSQHEDHPALARAARRLLWLTKIQILLGIAAYLSRILSEGALRPHAVTVLLTVSHVAVGALVMAASWVLTAEVFRQVRTACPVASHRVEPAG